MDRNEQNAETSSGDTNINYYPPAVGSNTGVPRFGRPTATAPIPEPVYTPPPSPSSGPRMASSSTTSSSSTSSSSATMGERVVTKQETHINWGGIIKGVAIIGAVVLVGVVGWWAAGHVAAWMTSSAAGGSLANSAYAVGHPIWVGLGHAASYTWGFITQVPGIVAHFFAGITGTGGATLAMAHGGAPAAAHALAATVKTLGVAGGVAVAAPVAAGGLSHLHLTQKVNVTEHIPVPGTETHHATTTSQQADAPIPDAPAQPHENSMLADLNAGLAAKTGAHMMSAEHLQHNAIEMSHHGHEIHENITDTANHGHHDAGDNSAYTPDVPDHPSESKKSSRNWADRFASASRADGSYAANVTPKTNAPVTPRAESFTDAVKDDRQLALATEAAR